VIVCAKWSNSGAYVGAESASGLICALTVTEDRCGAYSENALFTTLERLRSCVTFVVVLGLRWLAAYVPV
jgi:hypothetical protein